jgi:hypothetical protein
MEDRTRLRIHERPSQFNDGRAITVHQRSVKHVRWLYRNMRNEGLARADARMSLCFALAAGQRDARSTVEDAVRELG